MDVQREMIQHLLEKVKNSIATAEECEQLLQLLNGAASEETIAFITRYYEKQELVFREEGDPKWKSLLHHITAIDKEGALVLPAAPLRRVTLRRWYKVAAAAVLLGAALYFFLPFRNGQETAQKHIPVNIAAPQTNRAVITLANGNEVYLDSVANGQLAMQGHVKLVKLANGQVAYQRANGEMLKELQYNTLTNPKGSKVIDVQLSDGSHVWLNAGSSITYPVAFAGEERKVTLEGEGYFEVAKDPARKFIVSAKGINTTVLGTHFNVNAYTGEADTRVTLLEGSVNVSRQAQGDGGAVLKPGQQARIGGEVRIVNGADLPAVMAWKNGLFNFEGMSLKEAMMQVERWYDIEVEYEPGVPDVPLFGTIGRNLSLMDLLDVLGGAGFRFRLEAGRKLVLMK